MELPPHEQAIAGTVKGPYPQGDRFVIPFKYDATPNHTGKRMAMGETGLYTIQNGTIIKTEFFYSI